MVGLQKKPGQQTKYACLLVPGWASLALPGGAAAAALCSLVSVSYVLANGNGERSFFFSLFGVCFVGGVAVAWFDSRGGRRQFADGWQKYFSSLAFLLLKCRREKEICLKQKTAEIEKETKKKACLGCFVNLLHSLCMFL